jgi:hypothetical protein
MYVRGSNANQNEAFVRGMYQATLLRAPDAGGLANFIGLLNQGISREVITFGFVNSTENRTNQVNFFYKYFLGRTPDAGGLANWVGVLLSGVDEGDVMRGFILSTEFLGQNDNNRFVNLMYYALLSRQSDPTGFQSHINGLNAGASREVVLNSFLRSPEGINRLIDNYTATYLKVPTSAAFQSQFRPALQAKTMTFGKAASLILASQEFFNGAQANV